MRLFRLIRGKLDEQTWNLVVKEVNALDAKVDRKKI